MHRNHPWPGRVESFDIHHLSKPIQPVEARYRVDASRAVAIGMLRRLGLTNAADLADMALELRYQALTFPLFDITEAPWGEIALGAALRPGARPVRTLRADPASSCIRLIDEAWPPVHRAPWIFHNGVPRWAYEAVDAVTLRAASTDQIREAIMAGLPDPEVEVVLCAASDGALVEMPGLGAEWRAYGRPFLGRRPNEPAVCVSDWPHAVRQPPKHQTTYGDGTVELAYGRGRMVAVQVIAGTLEIEAFALQAVARIAMPPGTEVARQAQESLKAFFGVTRDILSVVEPEASLRTTFEQARLLTLERTIQRTGGEPSQLKR